MDSNEDRASGREDQGSNNSIADNTASEEVAVTVAPVPAPSRFQVSVVNNDELQDIQPPVTDQSDADKPVHSVSSTSAAKDGSDSAVGGGVEDDLDFDDELPDFRQRVYTAVSQYTQSDLSRMGMLTMIGDAGSLFGSSVLLSTPSYWSIGHEVEKEADREAKSSKLKLATSMEYLETIMENAEYIDTVQGKLPLAEAAKLIAQDKTKHQQLFNKLHVRKTRIQCYKKLVCIGFSFLTLFASFFSLRNLQSSRSDPIIGMTTFGCLTSLTWLGGLLCSSLLRYLRPKWILVVSSLPFVLYASANFYPTAWTLIPSALLMGLGMGVLWTAEGVYLINLAATYAFVSKKPLTEVIGKFNAVIFTMHQSSHLVGNTLSSLLLGKLMFRSSSASPITLMTSNITHSLLANTTTSTITTAVASNTTTTAYSADEDYCGLDFYSSPTAASAKPVSQSQSPDQVQMYILVGVLAALALIGCLNFAFLLQPLLTPKVTQENSLAKNFRRLLNMFARRRTWFLVPYFLYPGWSGSLLMADYTKAYITCAYGMSYIGYVLLTGACFSIAGAFISGRIVYKTGRIPVFLTATISTSSAVVVMRFWSPEVGSLSPVSFVPICLWCLGDGIILTQLNGFLGEFYRKELTYALSMLHLCYGIGAALGTLSSAFRWMTLSVKCYVTFSEVWLAFICFLVLERLLKLKKV